MEQHATLQKIRELIQPIFDEYGFYLVDIALRGVTGSRVLSIYADTRSGITLDQIAFLTREINDILDAHDLIEGAYRLDVSSPGLNRNLQARWEFEKNVGRDLRVTYQLDEVPETIVGRLTAVEEKDIELMTKKEKIKIPMKAILKARVHLKW